MTVQKLLESFIKAESIDKGWSPDKKFLVQNADEKKLLLRIADISELERKKAEYNALIKASALNSYSPQAYGFGLLEKENKVYYLVSWLEGDDAATIMTNMSENERYNLGIKSGKLLRRLHSLPAPDNAEPWHYRFQRKIDQRFDEYHMNKGQTKNGEIAIKYLSENSELLKNRPQTFNHGDFNTTNLIVSPNGEIGAIDFNCFNDNCDYGDPLWEMICISYIEEVDPFYYTGMWNGYANGKPDENFFKMTAYYFAYDILSSLGGTESFDNGNFDEKALKWYDNFNRIIPAWYLENFNT